MEISTLCEKMVVLKISISVPLDVRSSTPLADLST